MIQIQKIKDEKMRRRAAELKRLQKAARMKQEEIERRKKAEENKKKEEARKQEKLRIMGICPAGYRWIKQPGGYKCSAAGHFVSDAQLN